MLTSSVLIVDTDSTISLREQYKRYRNDKPLGKLYGMAGFSDPVS